MKTLGQIGFEASPIAIRRWEDVSDESRSDWESVAETIKREVLKREGADIEAIMEVERREIRRLERLVAQLDAASPAPPAAESAAERIRTLGLMAATIFPWAAGQVERNINRGGGTSYTGDGARQIAQYEATKLLEEIEAESREGKS